MPTKRSSTEPVVRTLRYIGEAIGRARVENLTAARWCSSVICWRSTSLRIFSLAAVFTACFANGAISAAVSTLPALATSLPPEIPVGYDSYRMWDHWPYQRIGMRAYLRSLFDREGGNEWADASHFLYQLADDRNVALDVEGKGILYFARYNHWHGSPWHYEVDGVDHVVQETSTADPLHPVPHSVLLPEQAFPKPLALTWSDTKGSDLSWVPVEFEHSFRMSYERTFYGTGYYIFDQFDGEARLSQPIAGWNPSDTPPKDVLDLLNSAGSDIAPRSGTNGVQEVSGRFKLGVKKAVAVWNYADGPSVLRLLEFSIPRREALAFSGARLRITWDGRADPSVDAPIALFFGAGVLYNRDNREYLVKSLPMVIHYSGDRVVLSCYFPMPFFRSANIQLVGPNVPSTTHVQWTIRYEPYTDPPNYVGYFHATYQDQDKVVPGKFGGKGVDMVLLNTRNVEGGGDWSGSLVGTSLIFSDDGVLGTLEGNVRFFFDDANTPQAQGDGTEDWGGGGDYWGGENMTLPFVGHPTGARSRSTALSPEDKIESMYRFLLADLFPFGRNALIQLERGAENKSPEHYQTVTYWYGLPAASLVQTDELAIGDTASELQHQYYSPDASSPYEVTSRYEWGAESLWGFELFPATTDRGRVTTTVSEFTLRVDPTNIGVMLRRKLDYAFPNQRAEIFVRDDSQPHSNWRSAGVWYVAGSTTSVFSSGGAHTIGAVLSKPELGPTEHIVQVSDRRFKDDEFLIPSNLTKGLSALRIRVKFTPVTRDLFPGHPSTKSAWSEMHYTAYSFVMPRFSLQPLKGP